MAETPGTPAAETPSAPANELYRSVHQSLRQSHRRRGRRVWGLLAASILLFALAFSSWLPGSLGSAALALGWLGWFCFLGASSWNHRSTLKESIALLKPYSRGDQLAIAEQAQRSFFKQDTFDVIILRTLRRHYGLQEVRD